MNSPITDLLIRIKNGYLAGKSEVQAIYSKTNHTILEILKKEKYVQNFSLVDENNKKHFVVELLYENKVPAVTDVKIISKPGQKIHAKQAEIPAVRGGLGIAVLSTSRGVMINRDAKKQGVGGQVLFYIW